MKLPFKLPAFKLPAFKLPSFGKKKAGKGDESDDSDDDWDEIDVDDAEPTAPAEESGEAEPPAPAQGKEPAAPGKDGDEDAPAGEEDGDPSALAALEDTRVDDSGDDDEDENEKSVIGRLLGDKKRRIMIAAAIGGVLVLAGSGMFLFSGDEEHEKKSREDSDVPRFEMAIAPKGRVAASGSLNAISETEKGPGAGVVTTATNVLAYAKITPPLVTDGPLSGAVSPDLTEQSHEGPLPKIAEDGRTALQVYAKTFDNKDDRSKIALIVTGLGLSEAATEAAIALLPGSVTLAFDPYAQDLQKWADKARQAGHEILIMVPMEPETFPIDDPGPQGLMTINSQIENLLRLEFILSRMQGYVGVVSVMGSKFNKNEDHLSAFLQNLKSRGLMFVDGSADPKSLGPALAEKIELPKAFADMVIDATPAKDAIDAKLLDLESVVRINAVAVALFDAYPVSIERIAAWVNGLSEKNMVLAPVSAISNRQFLQ